MCPGKETGRRLRRALSFLDKVHDEIIITRPKYRGRSLRLVSLPRPMGHGRCYDAMMEGVDTFFDAAYYSFVLKNRFQYLKCSFV